MALLASLVLLCASATLQPSLAFSKEPAGASARVSAASPATISTPLFSPIKYLYSTTIKLDGKTFTVEVDTGSPVLAVAR